MISRSYAMGMLLVWLGCAATRSRRPALWLGAVVGLLCQTTVYGYILAIALSCGWLLDRWLRRRELPMPPVAEIAVAVLLAAGGAIAGIVQLVQSPETKVPPFDFSWVAPHAQRVATIPWRAFAPVPLLDVQFWNTSILDPWPWPQALAGVLMLVLAFALLWRSRVAVVTFAIGAAGLLAFSYAFLRGSARHHGHLWLLFVAALWLGGGIGVAGARSPWRRRVLLALLVVQLAAGAFASWIDLRHPFSNGAATAALIRRQGLDRELLLGHREPPAATVALYLGQPLYAPSRQVFATHPDWGPGQRELSDPELRCIAREFARRRGRDAVLVLNRALPAWGELEATGSTSGAIEPAENYHLAWLRRARLTATAADAACPGEAATLPAGAGGVPP